MVDFKRYNGLLQYFCLMFLIYATPSFASDSMNENLISFECDISRVLISRANKKEEKKSESSKKVVRVDLDNKGGVSAYDKGNLLMAAGNPPLGLRVTQHAYLFNYYGQIPGVSSVWQTGYIDRHSGQYFMKWSEPGDFGGDVTEDTGKCKKIQDHANY